MIMKWTPGLDRININSQVRKIIWEKKNFFSGIPEKFLARFFGAVSWTDSINKLPDIF